MKKHKKTEPISGQQQHETEPGSEQPAAADDRDLQVECERLSAQLKRAMADLANIRKRQQKELEEARHRAIEALSAELLPVLDNFHLALAAHEQHEAGQVAEETHGMIEGLRMVRSLLAGVLERHGLEEISAHGTEFDPNLHEAVGIDAGSEAEPGVVTQVILRGYRFGEKVLRAPRVLVSGKPQSDDPEPRPDPSAS